METQKYYFLLLNILIFLAPFLANLYFKVPGLKRTLLNFVKTYSVMGIILTLFVSLIVSRGDWSFNIKYLTGINIGNLPLEVVLFFFAVPFASIALYELVNTKFKEKRILLDTTIFYLFAFTYFALSIVFSSYTYTSNIFLLLGVLSVAVSYFRKNNIFLSKNFYVFSLISVIAFIVVAVILAGTPFVAFSPTSYTGFKIGPIPFEEFFTSFLVLSSFLTVYNLFKKREA